MPRFTERYALPTKALMPMLLAGGLLAGCEAKVEAELDVSNIRERETTGLFATSRVSTDDCDRGIGSAEREGSLGWTNWVLSGVFPDTRFRGCREIGGVTTATFRNMIVFDASADEALKGQSHVNLKLNDGVLSIGLPAYVQGHVARVRDQVGAVSVPEIGGHLTLLNNSDEPFAYRVASDNDSGSGGWSEPRELPGASRVDIELPARMGERVLKGERPPLLKLE